MVETAAIGACYFEKGGHIRWHINLSHHVTLPQPNESPLAAILVGPSLNGIASLALSRLSCWIPVLRCAAVERRSSR